MAREIRGWNIGEVVTANEMTLNSANIYEETGSNGEANLPCIYNGLTLQSQAGTGNSIVTFNPGVARCQDLPTSTYTYLPTNAYGTGYPCYIDISVADSNTVITLATSPTPGYIVATFTVNPTTSGAVNYVITGSLSQIAIASYNPAIHVRLCRYTYTGSTFVLDFTPNTNRDTDFTGIGGINWNYQNSSLEINTPASQSGTSVVVKQPLTAASTTTLQSTTIIQSANAMRFYNSGNTHYTSLQSGASSSDVGFILPLTDGSSNQFMKTNGSGQLSFGSVSTNPTGNVAANDSNVTFVNSDNHTQVCFPTAARTYNMPSSGVLSGDVWTFYNQSTNNANYIVVQAPDSTGIGVAYASGILQIVALTNTPTTFSNWLVITRQSSWVNFSPTITGAGSITGLSAICRVVKDSFFAKAYWVSGTVAATTASLSLPAAVTVNTSLGLTNFSAAASSPVIGKWAQAAASLNGFMLVFGTTSNALVYFGGVTAGGSSMQSSNGSVIWNGSTITSCEFEVPVTGA